MAKGMVAHFDNCRNIAKCCLSSVRAKDVNGLINVELWRN